MMARWAALRKRYWDVRSARERRVLALGTLIVAPLLAYLLLWQPAHVATEKLHASVPTMRAQAARVRVQSEEVETLRHHPRPAVLDANALKAAVEESAVRHKLRDAISTLDAQEPHAVRVTLVAISFEQWISWLRDLQQEQHIRTESASIAALPQAGMVRINATLTSGGMQ